MIRNIQLLRAVAAILVVVCHSTGQWGVSYPFIVRYGFACGFTGVDLFFVISGFVITSVAAKSHEIGSFAFHRIVRIFPIYWVAITVASLISLITTGSLTEGSDVSFLRLATLTGLSPALGVAWTLQFEMFFYALVGIVMLLADARFKKCLIVFFAVYCISILGWQMAGYEKWFFTNPIILDFLFGIIVFWLVHARTLHHPVFFMAAGIIALALGTYLMMDDAWGHYVARPFYLGIPSAILLYGMIGLEPRWKAPMIAVAVGDASYSIYLWHAMIFHQVRILGIQPFPSLWTGAILVTLMVGVGMLSFRFIERPIAVAIKKAMRQKPQFQATN